MGKNEEEGGVWEWMERVDGMVKERIVEDERILRHNVVRKMGTNLCRICPGIDVFAVSDKVRGERREGCNER